MWLELLRLAAITTDSSQEHRKELPPDLDWPALTSLAIDEGIAPLLYLTATWFDAPVPTATLKELRGQYEAALMIRELYCTVLDELRPAMEKHGRVCLMQGTALCDRVYPHPLVRAMTDIDLLLLDGQQESVSRILGERGFVRYGDYEHLWQRGGVWIDLHTDPLGGDRIAARSIFAPSVSLTAKPSAIAPGYLVPEDEVLCYHVALHALKHGYGHLKWIVDIMLLERNGDLRRAEGIDRCGVVSAAYEMLDSAAIARYDPATAAQHAAAGGGCRRLIRRRLLRKRSRSIGEVALALSSPTAWGGLLYLMSSLWLSRRRLKEMYGDRNYPTLVLIRIVRILTHYGRTSS